MTPTFTGSAASAIDDRIHHREPILAKKIRLFRFMNTPPRPSLDQASRVFSVELFDDLIREIQLFGPENCRASFAFIDDDLQAIPLRHLGDDGLHFITERFENVLLFFLHFSIQLSRFLLILRHTSSVNLNLEVQEKQKDVLISEEHTSELQSPCK